MSGAAVSLSSSAMSLGIPRFSKRVLAHVQSTEQFGEFAEDVFHGEGEKLAYMLSA
jgi:hypothetical protein